MLVVAVLLVLSALELVLLQNSYAELRLLEVCNCVASKRVVNVLNIWMCISVSRDPLSVNTLCNGPVSHCQYCCSVMMSLKLGETWCKNAEELSASVKFPKRRSNLLDAKSKLGPSVWGCTSEIKNKTWQTTKTENSSSRHLVSALFLRFFSWPCCIRSLRDGMISMLILAASLSSPPRFFRAFSSSFSSWRSLNVKSSHFSPFGLFKSSLLRTVLARTSVRQ